MTGALEQVLEAQQRADSFAERILVGDHRGAGDSRGRSLILGQLCPILAHSPRIDNGRRYDVILDFAANVRYFPCRREIWRSSASGAPLLSITSSAKARRCSRVACAARISRTSLSGRPLRRMTRSICWASVQSTTSTRAERDRAIPPSTRSGTTTIA